MLREAAARAARDLPSSAHALDGLADIVAQGKEALSRAAGGGPQASDGGDSDPSSASGTHVRYSRFEAQLRALQADPATFTSDPEDAEDFAAWSKGFILDEREEEIEALCYDSDALEAMADRLVPDAVPREVFWPRLVPDILAPYAHSATAMLGPRPRRTRRSPSSSRGVDKITTNRRPRPFPQLPHVRRCSTPTPPTATASSAHCRSSSSGPWLSPPFDTTACRDPS